MRFKAALPNSVGTSHWLVSKPRPRSCIRSLSSLTSRIRGYLACMGRARDQRPRSSSTVGVKRVLRPLVLAGKHATARMVAGRIGGAGVDGGGESARARRQRPGGGGVGDALAAEGWRGAPHRALHFSDMTAALARVDGHSRIGRVVQSGDPTSSTSAGRSGPYRRRT